MPRNPTSPLAALSAVVILTFLVTGSARYAPEWQPTGTLEAVIDGQSFVLHSYATVVPEDAAGRATTPESRELLEKLAGTEQNSATWMVTEPFVMGGMVLSEAMMFVTIDTRLGEDPNADSGQVDITFQLDMETLELVMDNSVEVRYFPTGWDLYDFYALTEGALTLDSVEVADEHSLVITGAISGTLSHQDSISIEHNPADTLLFEATFTIHRVSGSDLLPELLGQ